MRVDEVLYLFAEPTNDVLAQSSGLFIARRGVIRDELLSQNIRKNQIEQLAILADMKSELGLKHPIDLLTSVSVGPASSLNSTRVRQRNNNVGLISN
jgi:hypothetical protein